ncbi:MAG: glyoxalase superfamily protein [Pseudomonadota bacterium]
MHPAVPILRIFDVELAKAFYLEFLGFEIEFEHRHTDNLPLYMGIGKGQCVLHLSEHFGDAAPGAHVRVQRENLDDFCDALSKKNFKFVNPGKPNEMPWGTKEITITDPFSNRLTFFEPVAPR